MQNKGAHFFKASSIKVSKVWLACYYYDTLSLSNLILPNLAGKLRRQKDDAGNTFVLQKDIFGNNFWGF